MAVELISFEFPLKGKLITSQDPSVIGDNFRSLKNLRYKEVYPEGVGGMTPRNSTALSNQRMRNAFHYSKDEPSETHLLVHAFDTSLANGKIYDHTIAIPSSGGFGSSALFTCTDATTERKGFFSTTPQSGISFCDGKDNLIWSGNEMEIGAFVNYDPAGTFYKDYTEVVNNTLTDANNIATLTRVAGTTTLSYYIGARRPLTGFKEYIVTGNVSPATMSVYEWQSTWVAVSSLVDGTSCGNKSMAKTGIVTFASTVATSKPKAINDVILYWYKIQVAGVDNNITVSHITNKAPMQSVKDLWDGAERIISGCYKYLTVSTTATSYVSYLDYTPAVYANNYDSNSSATFMNISSLATNQFILCGFLEQMLGMFIKVAPNYENTTASTVLALKYSSNGITWVDVPGLIDGTSVGGISLAKSGLITWNPPIAKINEFKRAISTDEPFWYYKLTWSQTLDATVRVYYIAGVSAPKTIQEYAIPMIAKNRLWLLKDNTAICSAQGLTEVWNGEDSDEFTFGDEKELVGGISLYSIIGSNIYEIALFFKRNSLYGISGNTPDDFILYEITLMDGLAAPKTLKRTISLIGGTPTPIVIWQGAKGIYIFDNKTPVPVHGDIDNFFNPNESSNTRKLHSSYIENSAAFIDEEHMEYHWLFADASSTGALNREYVFNLKSGKWFEINRGIGKYLQAGFNVTDTNGNKYLYGLTNTGIMERLEYGTHFDGNAIAHEIWTGDIAPLKGKIMEETSLRKLKMVSISTTATANNMVVKHYVDGATNASSSFTMSPMRTGYRITRAKHSLKGNPVGTFHSIRINISTTNQTVGFTPIYLGGHYERVREDL